jgi:hypothetical protein
MDGSERRRESPPALRGDIGRLVAGLAVTITDPDLRDAVFLLKHGTWDYASLQATPERVLNFMRAIERTTTKRG